MRTHTFASFFETSIPAHRGCRTSITHLTFPSRPPGVTGFEPVERVRVPGRADKKQALTRVLDGNNPRFPRTNYCALHHQTNAQARNTIDGSGSTGTHPGETHENCPRNALRASRRNARVAVSVVGHEEWVVDDV